ncbi:flavin reductase family protein [Streptomyces europaeiscabiei]|uniref:flavin reductase family protein n=1 Tax=Streptomyces europaeiscabiei TaxID=146819 RepID=UPI002E0D8A91|nr:flavin reductase [Streptomyces europaeiscabiei]
MADEEVSDGCGSFGERVDAVHAYATVLVLGGRLGDRYGRRRIFLGALGGLVLASPACSAANDRGCADRGPHRLSVCVQDTSTTWPKLRRRSHVGVSVLAQGQDEICRTLAGEEGDRFAGVAWDADEDGGVYIHGASLWLNCSLHAELPAGDHTIVLLEIQGLQARPDRNLWCSTTAGSDAWPSHEQVAAARGARCPPVVRCCEGHRRPHTMSAPSSAAVAMFAGHHHGLRLPGTDLADVMSLEGSSQREVQADCLSFHRDRLWGAPRCSDSGPHELLWKRRPISVFA